MLTKGNYEDNYKDFMDRFKDGRFFGIDTPEYRHIKGTVETAKECFKTHLGHLNDIVTEMHPDDMWFSYFMSDDEDHFSISVANKTEDEPKYCFHYTMPRIDNGDLDVEITDWDLTYNGPYVEDNSTIRYTMTEYYDDRSGIKDYDFRCTLFTDKMVDNMLNPAKKLANLGRYWQSYSARFIPDIGVYSMRESVNAFESKRKVLPLSEKSLRKNIRGIALRFEHVINNQLLRYDPRELAPRYFYN